MSATEERAAMPGSSADREARIAARRRRVQEKLAAVRAQAEASARGTAAPRSPLQQQQQQAQQQQKQPQQPQQAGAAAAAAAAAAQLGPGAAYPKAAQQAAESQRRLLRLRHRTTQEVSSVRGAADEAEAAHRAAEEQLRQELRGKLLEEAEASATANAQVAAGWQPLFDEQVPQALWGAMEEQRAACEAIISSKDALITELRGALRSKDDEYVRLLKRQAAEVDALLAAMGRQLGEMGQAYHDELEAIEGALLQERGELLGGNQKEVAAMLAARAQAEQEFTEKYLGSMERYQQQLEALRAHDTDEFHVLKIKLESDIATLEQHLGKMRAAYQLNAEKLEYNYRVLLERDAENTLTIHQQKRKLSQQHDVLAALKQKYAAAATKHQEENTKLTEEYKRVTEQFKDLQAKFHHFETMDATRFDELWQLQQGEASALARKLLAASRVIHEQQLGWAWRAPDERALFASPHDPPSGAMAVTTTITAGGAGATVHAAAGDDITEQHDTQQQAPDAGGAAEAGADEADGGIGAAADGEEEDGASSTGGRSAARASAEVEARLREPRYLGALHLLCDEAGFLLDSKALALVSKLPADEAGRVKAASIVRALGVADGAGFDALMEALAEGQQPGSFSGAEDGAPPPLLVSADDAVRRLREFVEYEQSQPTPGASAAGGLGDWQGSGSGSGGGGGGSRVQRLSSGGAGGAPWHASGARAAAAAAGARPGKKAGGVSRRVADRELEFWARLPQAVGDKEWRAWCALEGQLERYHALLTARAAGAAAVGGLRRQNDELRALLRQYLASDINKQLQVPPTALI